MDDVDSDAESDASTITVVAPQKTIETIQTTNVHLHVSNRRLRRSLSMIPCRQTEINEFLLSIHQPAIWTQEMKEEALLMSDNVQLESEDLSIYHLPSSSMVEESFHYAFDVAFPVETMQRVYQDIPLYPVVSWGRRLDPPMAFIRSHSWNLHNLTMLYCKYGEVVSDLMWPQLKLVTERLRAKGLWHSLLQSALIFVDNRWNIRHISGWRFCTELRDDISCGLSQLQQLYSRGLQRKGRFGTSHDIPEKLSNDPQVLAMDLAVHPLRFRQVPRYSFAKANKAIVLDLVEDEFESTRLPDYSDIFITRVVILCGRKCEHFMISLLTWLHSAGSQSRQVHRKMLSDKVL